MVKNRARRGRKSRFRNFAFPKHFKKTTWNNDGLRIHFSLNGNLPPIQGFGRIFVCFYVQFCAIMRCFVAVIFAASFAVVAEGQRGTRWEFTRIFISSPCKIITNIQTASVSLPTENNFSIIRIVLEIWKGWLKMATKAQLSWNLSHFLFVCLLLTLLFTRGLPDYAEICNIVRNPILIRQYTDCALDKPDACNIVNDVNNIRHYLRSIR